MSLCISVLVCLSYLLDFLKAVDFLGCEAIKSSLDEKIKEKINENNWVEVFKSTKGIMGLQKTTKHALEQLFWHSTGLTCTLQATEDKKQFTCTREHQRKQTALQSFV